jgi:tetratricopeptide (TPR) repeat protein
MSVEEARRNVEEKRRVFGDEALETLDSLSLLATALRDAGKYVEARRMVEELIRTRSRLYLNDEYAIQRLSLILGSILFAMGDFPSARVLEEGVLESFDKTSGVDSGASLTAARHLSNTLRALSDFSSLADLEQRIVDTLRRTRGEADADTLQAMSRLAQTKRQLADFQAAKDLDTMVIEIAERSGVDQRTVIEAKCNLFADLAQLKEEKARLRLLTEIYEESDRYLAKGDPLRKRIDRNRKLIKPLLRVARKQAEAAGGADDDGPRLHLPDTL